MFRITSISRIDGTPTTKQFRTYVAARNVFDAAVNDNNRSFFHYVGLFCDGMLCRKFDGKDVWVTADDHQFND